MRGAMGSMAQYAGHGQSKVVYRLTKNFVLKLCKRTDQEPGLFRALHAVGPRWEIPTSFQGAQPAAERRGSTQWIFDGISDLVVHNYPWVSMDSHGYQSMAVTMH